jgi:hypothetical protein
MRVIDLTLDDDQASSGNDDNITEVSWFRITRTARYGVRLIPPSLIDRFQVVDQLSLAPTVLFAEVTRLEEEDWEAIKLCSNSQKADIQTWWMLVEGPRPIPGKDREDCGLGL